MLRRYSSPGTRPGRGRAGASVVALAVLAGVLSGCTDDPVGEASSAATAAAPTVRVRVTRVAGDLSAKDRAVVARKARALVTAYVAAAFGDRPDGGKAAYPGFTRGARSLAVHDRSVLTSAGLEDADRVEPRRIAGYVAVLAPHRRAVGATVRLGLELAVTRGSKETTRHVTGRLLLTPTGSGWRIFGYDLAAAGEAR